MSIHRNPRIVTEGLVFGYDADDRSNYYKGEPTTNLLYDNGVINWSIGNLTARVNITTVILNSVYRITSTTSGSFRFYVPLSKLTNGLIYNLSFRYKIISGGTIFTMNDWCDTSITKVTTIYSDYIFQTAYGSRTTYDNTFRFMDFEISSNTVVEIWNVQLEQKNHATPFTTGTRSVTESLIDLKKTKTIDLSNVSFDSIGQLYFNGISNYIPITSDIVPVSDIRLNGVTYAAWIKPSNVTNNQRIVGQQIGSGYSDYSSGGLCIDNQRAKMVAYNDAGGYVYTNSNTILEVNKWYYIVGTFDTNDKFLRLYVNGVLDGISTAVTIFSRLLTNSSNRIGSKDGTTTLPFNGLISNVKIYNKTLSINEILINYNAFKTRFNLV